MFALLPVEYCAKVLKRDQRMIVEACKNNRGFLRLIGHHPEAPSRKRQRH